MPAHARMATVLCLFAGLARPAVAQVDQERAQQYFKEAQSLCERDGGRLWGVAFCGPMVIGDMRTQTFAASEPPPDAARPQLVGLVNAPLQWGGTTWGAYVWDFVANETPRNAAVRDALVFRQARRAQYAEAADRERPAEITEGLAFYTATVVAASSPAEAIASAVDHLSAAEQQESFVRTFAYASGPAYGVLLDAASPGWTRRVRGADDLATLAMNALAVQAGGDAAASALRDGGAELRVAEQQRDQQRQERLAELRRRFVDGPVLLIQGGGRGSSDARGAVAIPGSGTVFFGADRASGAWGTLEANNGVLVASDGTSRRVSAPVRRGDGSFSGDGWTFRPAPGWIVREGARKGDYEVVQQQP